jgi:hypothetical protein
MKDHNMDAIGLGNTRILTDHVSKHPWTLDHLLKARLANEKALHSCLLHLDHVFIYFIYLKASMKPIG